MTEPKFRYEVNGKMEAFTLSQIVYGYLPKDVLHPEHYKGAYTGLLDKHLNEIYGGDIVNAWSAGSNANCEVRWSKDTCRFFLYRNPHICWNISASNGVETIEIIGNIHHNPELLEK